MGGNPGAQRDYMQRVAAQLARAKRFPRRARIRGQEGLGHLSFTLDASGRVMSHRIVRGTGHDMLDRELRELIARAGPFPPFPETITTKSLELVVPVRFALD